MRKGERELKKQRQYKPREREGEKEMVITGGKFDLSLRGVYIVNN